MITLNLKQANDYRNTDFIITAADQIRRRMCFVHYHLNGSSDNLKAHKGYFSILGAMKLQLTNLKTCSEATIES